MVNFKALKKHGSQTPIFGNEAISGFLISLIKQETKDYQSCLQLSGQGARSSLEVL